MKMNGYSQVKLAKELGVTQFHISMVMYGRRKSDRVQRAMARVIGKPVWVVFPDDYPAPKRQPSKHPRKAA
jgi:lambda repressor-like predicted transcriptional regulator